MGNHFNNANQSGVRANLASQLLLHLHFNPSPGRVPPPLTTRNMLPEVGDLQRSSDVAEPSLMSHRPAEIRKPRLQGVCVCVSLFSEAERPSARRTQLDV